MNQSQIIESMQVDSSDRLFLRLAIVDHSDEVCPVTENALNVETSFMIEGTHPCGHQEWLGPFDKSVYQLRDLDAITWFKEFLSRAGHDVPDSVNLREIKG